MTKMVKDFVSLAMPSVTLTDALCVPASPETGARWTTPEVSATVMKDGPVTFWNWSASPSASVPLRVCSEIFPSTTVISVGCARTGAWLIVFTVIWKDLSLFRLPSVARTVAEAVPMSESPGARWTFPVAVPLPPSVVVTLAYVGPEAREKESPFPSGSVAVIA